MPDRALTRCIIAVSLLFIIASLTGYLVPLRLKEGMAGDLSHILAPLKELSPPAVLLFIFLNNALKGLIAILLGCLFGVVPIIFVAGNGYLLGLLISLSLPQIGPQGTALRILPHAIFEIPAFLVAGGFGLWLGVKFIGKIRRQNPFIPSLSLSLKYYVRVLVPLFLAAALIETFITPLIAGISFR